MNLKKHRETMGWTQQQLAEKMNTTTSTISKWESKKYDPTLADTKKLAELFGLTVDVLIREENVVSVKKPRVISKTPHPVLTINLTSGTKEDLGAIPIKKPFLQLYTKWFSFDFTAFILWIFSAAPLVLSIGFLYIIIVSDEWGFFSGTFFMIFVILAAAIPMSIVSWFSGGDILTDPFILFFEIFSRDWKPGETRSNKKHHPDKLLVYKDRLEKKTWRNKIINYRWDDVVDIAMDTYNKTDVVVTPETHKITARSGRRNYDLGTVETKSTHSHSYVQNKKIKIVFDSGYRMELSSSKSSVYTHLRGIWKKATEK